MPARDLDLLINAARAAGDVVRPFFRNAPRQWEKDAGAGPVTEADLAVNDRLEQILRAARPDYGWLSEESPGDPGRLAATDTFVIDPIDGTRAFIDGQDTFSHALAVVRGGEVRAAVVYLPMRDTLYAATVDGEATRNGQRICVSTAAQAHGAHILTGKPSLDPLHWRHQSAPVIRRDFRPSIAWRLCLVAEGRFDGALSFRPTWDWDIAAGALIAERAGATATTAQGEALRFNTATAQNPGLWVAPPALHTDLLSHMTTPTE